MLVLVVHPTKQQKKEAALQKACRRCSTFFLPKTCTSAKPQIKNFFDWVLLQIIQDAAQVES
jgi:RNA polymerase subunit RPABC4/transcription elongation factor Spt4